MTFFSENFGDKMFCRGAGTGLLSALLAYEIYTYFPISMDLYEWALLIEGILLIILPYSPLFKSYIK